MSTDKTEKEASFVLFPIGAVSEAGGKIIVSSGYIRGLKHLKDFSHIHVFYRDGSFARKTTARIISLDPEKGLICTEGCGVPESSDLLDIKPYMPSEDRLHTADPPSEHSEPFFRISPDSGGNGFRTSEPAGYFRISGRKSFLELTNPEDTEKLAKPGYITAVWYFNRFDSERFRRILVCKPPYDAPETGVFASRSPVRPNPIGLTVIKVLGADPGKNRLLIDSTDALDGTPVLAAAPYSASSERIDGASVPLWLSHWPDRITERKRKDTGLVYTPPEAALLFQYAGIEPADAADINNTVISAANAANAEEPEQKDRDFICISGARQNNLRNIDVSIPAGRLSVITGVSGSGKSSLAFDTLYAESCRRFARGTAFSSGSYAVPEKPDVDRISNLFPAIAVDQKSIHRNSRSTVGSVTDIYDLLRLLYARLGTRHCPDCGTGIEPVSAEKLAETIRRMSPGTEIRLYAGRGQDAADKRGRVFIAEDCTGSGSHFLDDLRLCIKELYSEGKGFITILVNGEPAVVSDRDACTRCSNILFKLGPSLFSFNSPSGMCASCRGTGVMLSADPDRIIDKPHLSLLDGASSWYGNLRSHMRKPNANWMRGELLALAMSMNIDLELPWRDLPGEFRQKALYGTGEAEVSLTYSSGKTGRSGTITRPVTGAVNYISKLLESSKGDAIELYGQFVTEQKCPDCCGEKLQPEGRSVFLAGRRFPEAAAMTAEDALAWTASIPDSLPDGKRKAAADILEDLETKLRALIDTGLHYMNLDRPVTCISGGEAQRIKLSAQLGCGLSGILYILDEPSAGLHPSDHARIISVLKSLRDEGNTIVVVEHDEQTIREADHLIDIGPGAGKNGGLLVARGTPAEVSSDRHSITGAYLSGKSGRNVKRPVKRPDQFISLKNADLHNLKNVSVDFPSGMITCVTGVSGSGKSSLVKGTLIPGLKAVMEGRFSPYISSTAGIRKIISADQSPIGRSPRSVPATYAGFFSGIRDLFAAVPESVRRGYKASRFSFNDKNGRCPACEGLGSIKLDLGNMEPVWIKCAECGGRRYSNETLEIEYKGRNIYEVLEMDACEAAGFFAETEPVASGIRAMINTGLGYLKIGQNSATLSGGEAQRLKIASELAGPVNGDCLYIFDEPTAGLHFADIETLLALFRTLSDSGGTVIIIEHNPDVIMASDWVVDLGPGGGVKGGRLIECGPPESIQNNPESITGRFLKNHL